MGDIRYALRAVARRPLFLSASVLSIGIGAGLNLGLYAILRHVLFDNPMIVAAPDRFVRVEPGVSFPNYEDLRRANLPMELAAMQMATLTWQTGDAVRPVAAHVVSYNLFETLGVRPALGRAFTDGDSGGPDVVVVSFTFWQRILDSDPTTIGRRLILNGWPYTIVGVLPSGFAINPMVAGLVYVPIGGHVSTGLDNRRAAQFDLIGRLRDRSQASDAMAALRVAAGQLHRNHPEIPAGFAQAFTATSLDVFSLLRNAPAGRAVLAAAVALYGLVGLVLLIGCANVAGLMLIRLDERRLELSIQMALGATRSRLVQQALIESLAIGSIGCAVGLGWWFIATAWLRRLIASASTVDVAALSGPVPLAYCVMLIGAVTVGCGAASAWRILGLERTGILRSGPGGGLSRRTTTSRGIVAFQIAVCFVLLAGTVFFVTNVVRLRIADPGFVADGVLSVDVRSPPSVGARNQLAIRGVLDAEPGVESVSWGSPIGAPFAERLSQPGRPDQAAVTADVRVVGPRFFDTMRLPMTRGRDMVDSDLTDADPRNVAVNEAFVRRYLPTVDPIGQRFVRPRNPDSGRPEQVLLVIGIARDSMARTVGEGRVPVVYLPQPSQSFMIRVARVDAETTRRIHDRISRLEPPGSVVAVVPLAASLQAAQQPVQIAAGVLAILAAIGVVLAGTGLYAVVAYAAARRTREIGIRVALGATRTSIVKMILRDTLQIVGSGCALGAALSWVGGRLAQALIVQQPFVAPSVFLGVTVLLIAIALAGTLHPARRAAGTDPIRALRHD